MRLLPHGAIARRVILALAVLLIGASIIMSALALGGIQTITDDYGITIGAPASDCGPAAVWDATINQCVPLMYDDD